MQYPKALPAGRCYHPRAGNAKLISVQSSLRPPLTPGIGRCGGKHRVIVQPWPATPAAKRIYHCFDAGTSGCGLLRFKSFCPADQYDPKLLSPFPQYRRRHQRPRLHRHPISGACMNSPGATPTDRRKRQKLTSSCRHPRPAIIESKSLSSIKARFAQTRFAGGAEQVAAILKRDFSNAAGAPG